MPIPANDFVRDRARELITSTKVNSFQVSTITPLPFQPVTISWDVEPPMQVRLSMQGESVSKVGSKEFRQFMKTQYRLSGRVGAEHGNIRTVTVEPDLSTCTPFMSSDGIESSLNEYFTIIIRQILAGDAEGFEDLFESFPELEYCYLPANEEVEVNIENGFIRLTTKLKYSIGSLPDPTLPITLDFKIIANKYLLEGGVQQHGEVKASSFAINFPWYVYSIPFSSLIIQQMKVQLNEAFRDGMKILADLLADAITMHFRLLQLVPEELRFHHAICRKEADNEGLLNMYFCPNYISDTNPSISIADVLKDKLIP